MLTFKLVSNIREWPLVGGENIIGSYAHCEVQLKESEASGESARLDISGSRVFLTNLDDNSNLKLDGKIIEGTVVIEPEQSFTIGTTTFVLRTHTPEKSLSQAIQQIQITPRTKKVTKIALAIIASIIIILTLFSFGYSAQRFKKDFITLLDGALGRNVEVSEVNFSLLSGRADLSDIRILSLPEFGSRTFIQARELNMQFGSGQYIGSLGKNLQLDIDLKGLVILFQRDKNGTWNTSDIISSLAQKIIEDTNRFEHGFENLSFSVNIQDAKLLIRDGHLAQNREFAGINLSIHLDSITSQLKYQLTAALKRNGKAGKIMANGEFNLFDKSKPVCSGRIMDLTADELAPDAIGLVGALINNSLQKFAPIDSLSTRTRISSTGLEAITISTTLNTLSDKTPEENLTAKSKIILSAPTPSVEHLDVTLKGRGFNLAAQGRIVPNANWDEAEVLDLDITAICDLNKSAGAKNIGLLKTDTLDGILKTELSTTGSTQNLNVNFRSSLEGLDCTTTGPPPEDLLFELNAELGLRANLKLHSLNIKHARVQSGFLDAELPPGEITSLDEPKKIRANFEPLEFYFDAIELLRRYGPLLPYKPATGLVAVRADLKGEDGRLETHFLGSSSRGFAMEGSSTINFLPQVPILEFGIIGHSEESLSLKLGGLAKLKKETPEFELSVNSNGELQKLLVLLRPYLNLEPTLKAQGRFNLEELLLKGTPNKFSTKGKIAFDKPHLLKMGEHTPPKTDEVANETNNADPKTDQTTHPLDSSSFDINWDLDFDISKDTVALSAKEFKANSPALRFDLGGEISNLKKGLGKYTLKVGANFDTMGRVLKQLHLIGTDLPLEGSLRLDLTADTTRGDVNLRRLTLDAPFARATGSGTVAGLPLLWHINTASTLPLVATNISGNLKLDAEIETGKTLALLTRMGLSSKKANYNMGGTVHAKIKADGKAGELNVDTSIDLDNFEGSIGRVFKKPKELKANIQLLATLSAKKSESLKLNACALELAYKNKTAKFDIQGNIKRHTGEAVAQITSKGFDILPLAMFTRNFTNQSTGRASADITLKGLFADKKLLSGTTSLLGSVDLNNVTLVKTGLENISAQLKGVLHFVQNGVRAKELLLTLRQLGEQNSPPLPPLTEMLFKEYSLTKNAKYQLQFTALARTLDVEKITKLLWAAKAKSSLFPALSEFSGGGSLELSRAIFKKNLFEPKNISCEFQIKKSKVDIILKQAELWGGALKGQFSTDATTSPISTKGVLTLKDFELEELGLSLDAENVVRGQGELYTEIIGSGLTRKDFMQNWFAGISAHTKSFEFNTELLALTKKTHQAIESLFQIGELPTTIEIQPLKLQLAFGRSRITLASALLKLKSQLELNIRGRFETDGRIACWISVFGLPQYLLKNKTPRTAILKQLVERGALRFGITGSFLSPRLDIGAILRKIDSELKDSRTKKDAKKLQTLDDFGEQKAQISVHNIEG